MNRATSIIFCTLLVGSVLLSSCSAPKEEAAEDVQEKPMADVVQLDPDAVKQANMTTVTVQSREISNQIETVGEVKPNENRVFQISSFVSGRVIRDNVLLGDFVRQGQTLATVQNLEVAKIQADYIHELHNNEIQVEKDKSRLRLTKKNLEREQRLLAEGISPRKDYQQALNDYEMAQADMKGDTEHQVHIKAEGKALLSAYGMKPGSIHSESIRTGSPVTAPRAGMVLKKNITVGDMVAPDTILYEIADLSQIWLDITVYPKDLSTVKLGQSVLFKTDSLPGKTFQGQVNYIQPTTNEESETYVARSYLVNTQGLLKPGMLGHVEIDQVSTQHKIFVPDDAVQKYGKEVFVFVKLGNNQFRKTLISLGEKVAGGYLVNKGLQAGEQIVVNGSFTLKAAMLKSQFAEEE